MQRFRMMRNVHALALLLAAFFVYETVCRDLPKTARVEKVSIRKRPTLQASGDDFVSQTNLTRSMTNNSTVVVLVVAPSSSSSSSSSSSRNISHHRQTAVPEEDYEDVILGGGRGGGGSAVHHHKQRLIRGSKKAATITKKEYLKKDWCKTEAFQQVVHEHGCVRKRIVNRFCYGQCNSFFIPKSDEDDQDGGSFRSCAYCMPIDSEWVDVVLHCPKKTPSRVVKRVQIVSQCKCMAVNLESGVMDSLV